MKILKGKDWAEKIQNAIYLFVRLSLVIAIISEVFKGRWSLFFITTLIFLSTFLPLLFEKRYEIIIPLELELTVVVFIYASLYLGEVQSYYQTFWWWDLLLHAGSGLGLGFIGFIILYTIYYREKIVAKPFWIAVFTLCFAIAIGTVWEIFEFGMDQVIGTNMQRTGILDTMGDLIVDSIGGLIMGVVGYFYFKLERLPIVSRVINKFVEQNPELFKNMEEKIEKGIEKGKDIRDKYRRS